MEEEDSRRAFFGGGRREDGGGGFKAAFGGGRTWVHVEEEGVKASKGQEPRAKEGRPARAKGQEPKVKGVRSIHPISPRTLSVRS